MAEIHQLCKVHPMVPRYVCACNDAAPLSERAPEVAELVAAIKTAGGFGPHFEPHERSDIIAELLTQWLDWHGYEMGGES